MRFIAGTLNNQRLQNLLGEVIGSCTRVRAAVAYAKRREMRLFEACKRHEKPLEFFGRYDHTVAVAPEVLKWFLDQKSPQYACKLVPDILHAKVIWWVGAGAYIGSANLTQQAWDSNIEAGVFLEQDELEEGMESELQHFFAVVNERARPLTDEIYKEQKLLAERRKDLSTRDYEIERQFEESRRLPKSGGLNLSDVKPSTEKSREDFEREWNETLQLIRDIADRVSDMRPGWIDASVAKGVQADQFLHAYYSKRVGRKYEESHERNKNRPEAALQEALEWWRAADYDHAHEESMIYESAPRLRSLLASDRILTLSEEEFTEVVSRVYAFCEHARYGGKPSDFAKWLLQQQSRKGHTVLELLHYVVWGGDGALVGRRLWNAKKSAEWKITDVGPKSLGEIVGWARPDEFPPRNGRTNKALRALGYDVQVSG